MVNDPRVAAKAAAAEQYCRQMLYRFVFWTEKMLTSDLPPEQIIDLLLKEWSDAAITD